MVLNFSCRFIIIRPVFAEFCSQSLSSFSRTLVLFLTTAFKSTSESSKKRIIVPLSISPPPYFSPSFSLSLSLSLPPPLFPAPFSHSLSIFLILHTSASVYAINLVYLLLENGLIRNIFQTEFLRFSFSLFLFSFLKIKQKEKRWCIDNEKKNDEEKVGKKKHIKNLKSRKKDKNEDLLMEGGEVERRSKMKKIQS